MGSAPACRPCCADEDHRALDVFLRTDRGLRFIALVGSPARCNRFITMTTAAGRPSMPRQPRRRGESTMDLGRLGVWYSIDRLDGPQIRAILATVEGHGYGTFWYPESRGYESLSAGGFLLANSTRLLIGSSIASIYARDAFT